MMKHISLNVLLFLGLNSIWATAQEVSPKATPEAPPSTRVQIVNATSVPSISMEVNGRMHYPDFPQGQYTADGSTEGLNYKYKLTNKTDGTSDSPKAITYKNQENQTLLILGDFSREAPEGKMPQPSPQQQSEEEKNENPPNVILRVYSHQADATKKPVCLRIINGMPRKILRFKSPGSNSDLRLFPGDEIQLEGQPAAQKYNFIVDEKPFHIAVRQDDNPRSANIVFFLKNNEPAFLRFYQSIGEPAETPDTE